jgi:hypothetical protein
MAAVLTCALLFVKYPDMPVDPASLAGRVYYLCDSDVAAEISSSWPPLPTGSEMRRAEINVSSTTRYKFGKMVGISGRKTVGVFAVSSSNHRPK